VIRKKDMQKTKVEIARPLPNRSPSLQLIVVINTGYLWISSECTIDTNLYKHVLGCGKGSDDLKQVAPALPLAD